MPERIANHSVTRIEGHAKISIYVDDASEIENLGHFPSLFLATVSKTGELAYCDLQIRIVDNEGNIVADGLDPSRYHTYLGEACEESGYMKFMFYKPLGGHSTGRPGDARIQIPREKRGLHSFHYHLARLIEMLHCVERIEEITADPELLGTHVRARAGQNRSEGIGSCEAPRGTLSHHYEVDDNGLVRKANLLIATAAYWH